MKAGFWGLLLLWLCAGALQAETRAYRLELFDHISKKKWETNTSFSAQQYILTHGGSNRLSALVMATWICRGDTSGYQPPCPMPEPKGPLFLPGDIVEVTLDKHLTQGWRGRVELSLYREDLFSNVYGVRFGSKRQSYGRYFEFNLKLVERAAKAPAQAQGGPVLRQGAPPPQAPPEPGLTVNPPVPGGQAQPAPPAGQ